MLGPHITGFSFEISSIIFAIANASRRFRSSVILSRNAVTLAFVGFVLGSGIVPLYRVRTVRDRIGSAIGGHATPRRLPYMNRMRLSTFLSLTLAAGHAVAQP